AAEQVVASDGELLVLGVAVETDDLHTVEERTRNRVGHIGSGDEQHLGQVELDLEVVVTEGVVLGWVEDREQGRGRAAPPIGAQTRARTAPGPRSDDAASPRSTRNLRTARYSTMRSLTSSRPLWSASRIARASVTCRWSSERVPHGSSTTVSSQVRIQPCSGLCSLVRSRRPSSRSTAAFTCSGASTSASHVR